MELDLCRVDYTIVGLTSTNCMKLLPPTQIKEPQKIAVADKDGILQVFSIKKEDISLIFKTLPGPEVSSLSLGGAVGGTANDKIFIALESEVHGYTKKGKLFLTFDSCMTEPIVSMFVLGNDLFLCGNHIYNHYRDCKEIGSYLCGDKIIDVIALHQEQTGRLISLIACEGRMVRVLEHGRVTVTMEVDSAPTVLYILEQDEEKTVIFGTSDGRIGVLDIKTLQGFERWLIANENTSSVSCIESYDLTGDGNNNIIIGKQDGNIEIYNINIADPNDTSILIYQYNCNESVTSVQCGILNIGGFDEVLVCTYTGRIFALTTEKIEKNVEKNNQGENLVYSADTANKITKLRNEVEDLQRKVTKEREKYQASTQSFFEEYSAIPLLSVNDAFVLDNETATYTLTIEVPTAIDNILLQSNVHLDLLDVEKNTAVVSHSECSKGSGNALLVTYRCQMNTNRLEIKMRTIEGQEGILQAYVTPMIQPKCSRVRKYDIKPLSLHFRIHTPKTNGNANTLSLKGNFSLAEIHTWIYKCLPEVPEKPQLTQQNGTNLLYFKSSFIGTFLECSYMKNEATFKSNSISTISIIKEFISNEATKKNIKVDFSIVIDDETIDDVLKLILPNLQKYEKMKKDIILLEALNELELSDAENSNTLSKRYKELLAQESTLKKDYLNHPAYLDRLYGIVCDLYLDYNKCKGLNAKSKLPQLMSVLEDVNYEKLLNFFKPPEK